MKRAILAFSSLALLVLSGACIKVVHDHDCDGGIIGGTTGGGPGVVYHAQVLYVVNLQRSAANLAGTYSDLIRQLNAALGERNLTVDQFAVLPIYGGVDNQPQLIYGEPSATAGALSAALNSASLSGLYDQPLSSAEQHNLAAVAAGLDQATLPPPDEGGQSPTFFGAAVDLFLVVTLQTTRRLCADTDAACALGGSAPLDVFTAVTDTGAAAWLHPVAGSYPAARVYQLYLSTAEQISYADLQARCSAKAGFPKTLLDVLQPSEVPYYGPLSTGLAARGWHAAEIDFCDAISAAGPQLLKDAAAAIAAAAVH